MSEERPKPWKIPPHEKRLLLIDLAKGELQNAQIARKYGTTDTNIGRYKETHAATIAKYREEFASGVEEKTIGLWIADRASRVAAIQDIANRIDNSLPEESVDKDDSVLLKVKLQALRQASEELGQLVQRIDAGAKVTYTVEGVDLDGLK